MDRSTLMLAVLFGVVVAQTGRTAAPKPPKTRPTGTNAAGNRPLANQETAAALRFAGWDYKFVFGTGGHDHRQPAAVFPDTMRWRWRDYAK